MSMSDRVYYILVYAFCIVWILSSTFRWWLLRKNRQQAKAFEAAMKDRLERLHQQVDERSHDFQEIVDVINHEYYQIMNSRSTHVSDDLKGELKKALDRIEKESNDTESPKQ